MGRDAGGHADGNTGASIAKQIGEFRRKDDRFRTRIVIIRHVINRVLFQVFHKNHGDFRHARLCVTHGCGRVAVYGAEVSLSIDEGIPEVKILRHTNKGGVNHLLAVRVIISRGIAGDFRTFPELGTGPQIQVVHGNQDTSLRRLQAVPYVRKRAAHDNAHRVTEVRILHLFFDE